MVIKVWLLQFGIRAYKRPGCYIVYDTLSAFVNLIYSLHNILYLPILVIRLVVDDQGIWK